MTSLCSQLTSFQPAEHWNEYAPLTLVTVAGHVTMAVGDGEWFDDGVGATAGVGVWLVLVGETAADGEGDEEARLEAWDTGVELVPHAANRSTKARPLRLTRV